MIRRLMCLAGIVFAVLLITPPAVATIGPSQEASRGPNLTVEASRGPNLTLDAAARRYSCPTGDGSASWGDAKVCTDAAGARFHFRDKITDGHCVRMRYWSADNSAWLQTGPTACVTGQWVTSTDCCAKLCSPNVRLYRDDGAYFTPPNNYC